jgi:hypothetical protein
MLLFLKRVIFVLAFPTELVIWSLMWLTQALIITLNLQSPLEDNVGSLHDFTGGFPSADYAEEVCECCKGGEEYDYDAPVTFDDRRGWLLDAYKCGAISHNEYLDAMDAIAKEEKLLTELSNDAREQLEDAEFDMDAYVGERLADRLDDNDADLIAAYQSVYGAPEALAEDAAIIAESKAPKVLNKMGKINIEVVGDFTNFHEQVKLATEEIKKLQASWESAYAGYPPFPSIIVNPGGVEIMNVNGLDIEVQITRQDEIITVTSASYPNIIAAAPTVTRAKYAFRTSLQAAYPEVPVCDEPVKKSRKKTSHVSKEID